MSEKQKWIVVNAVQTVFPQIEEDSDVAVVEDTDLHHSIIVWNDEVNTFDWVIQSLMEICDHTLESAEQCALIVHHNGKYAVKKGSFGKLRPMCEALLDRGISATID